MKKKFPILFTILILSGCSNDAPQANDMAKIDFDKKKAEIQKSIAEQAEKDRPHFEIPTVDYTFPVAKVDMNNDEEIIAALGSPVVEKETGVNQNGEPMTTYYFSEDKRNSLELSLSREFIDVAWQYNQDNPEKATAVFKEGQRITRALLGGEIGAGLYESLRKGAEIDAISFEDGTNINHARCGESICRYQIERN